MKFGRLESISILDSNTVECVVIKRYYNFDDNEWTTLTLTFICSRLNPE